MDRLWAPWRINYVSKKQPQRCIFCACAHKKNQDYLIFMTRHSLGMLNAFPYNNGHMMVAPIRHTDDFSQLNDQQRLDLFRAIERAKRLLDKVLKPHGYNIGINISGAAGAGIIRHMHIHIVPRWRKDTNFMPVLYNTNVISQSLAELRQQLKRALKTEIP